MSDRNQPCPCGSGKKFKKCCGVIAKAAPREAGAAASPAPAAPAVGEGKAPKAPAASAAMPFYRHTGRGLGAERTAADRHRHLRRRLQDGEMKGTLGYNNGAFFRPPPPR